VAVIKAFALKRVPFTVVLATPVPPRFPALTRVPTVLTSLSPEIFCAAPQVTTAACEVIPVTASVPRMDATRNPRRMDAVMAQVFIRVLSVWQYGPCGLEIRRFCECFATTLGQGGHLSARRNFSKFLRYRPSEKVWVFRRNFGFQPPALDHPVVCCPIAPDGVHGARGEPATDSI